MAALFEQLLVIIINLLYSLVFDLKCFFNLVIFLSTFVCFVGFVAIPHRTLLASRGSLPLLQFCFDHLGLSSGLLGRLAADPSIILLGFINPCSGLCYHKR